ncbi:hypothetical protein ACGF8B_25865 [Streptomyces sp. NPDC047917]|uniref:hypothetical protein n=1 Tax=Streptomyces sp. NPDC047917 TaxID=3365491 RepID=UPI00371E00CF
MLPTSPWTVPPAAIGWPRPLSQHSLLPEAAHNGLVLGYGNTSEPAFASGLRQLTQLVRGLE